jgi:hypothetical protein
VVEAEAGHHANKPAGCRKSHRRTLADLHRFRDAFQTLHRIADRGYGGPDLTELVTENLHSHRATHPYRHADDNRVHVLAAPFETGVQRAADR